MAHADEGVVEEGEEHGSLQAQNQSGAHLFEIIKLCQFSHSTENNVLYNHFLSLAARSAKLCNGSDGIARDDIQKWNGQKAKSQGEGEDSVQG